MIFRRSIIAVAALFTLAVFSPLQAKTEKSPFLGDLSKFESNSKRKTLHVEKTDGKRASDYQKIMFEPVQVLQSEHSKQKPLTEEDRATISELLRNALVDAFKDTVQIVDQPGPGVLQVRAAVRGLERGNYRMTSGGPKAISPNEKLIAGTFELEALDAQSHERVVALYDQISKKTIESANSKELVLTVQELFKDWAMMLRHQFKKNQIVK